MGKELQKEDTLLRGKTEYVLIDYLKLFCAFLVIVIHTHPFYSISEKVDILFIRNIACFAVPFFYVCTGYFMEISEGSLTEEKLKNKIKKTFVLYIILTVVYLPLTCYDWITNGNKIITNIMLFIRNFLLVGENAYSWTLWYLNGLIVVYVILFYVYKRLTRQGIFIFGVILYLIGMLLDFSYLHLALFPEMIRKIISLYFGIFVTTRNGIFQSFVWVAMGMFIGEKKIERNLYTNKRTEMGAALAIYICQIPFSIMGEGYVSKIADLFIFWAFFSWVVDYSSTSQVSIKRKLNPIVCRYLSSYIYYTHMYFVAFCAIVLWGGGGKTDIMVSFLFL